MLQSLWILARFLADFFRPRAVLQAENALLRHQLSFADRKLPRPRLTMFDRLFFVLLYRLHPGVLDAMCIVRPETVIRWHRMGFKALWGWKSRARGGRPKISREIRGLIREMSLANPLWGAPRIHGELAMIGVDVAQSTVAKYMARRSGAP
ncbi:MAG: helix-turn-helix domain-containing protein, partial [Parvularculaceae bacterium]